VDTAENAAPVATLLENHRAFLRYLERRVGDRALAEDILQDAFAKVVARPDQAPDGEAIVPWFYRTLRNAAIDQSRPTKHLASPASRR
jgi:RNA polymerase sigma-70 factor (ECF subfamily)